MASLFVDFDKVVTEMWQRLKKVFERKPPSAESLRRQALKFLKQGKPQKALALLQQSLELEPSNM